MEKGTISVKLVNEALRAAHHRVDVAPLLARAGIAAASLGDGEARVSAEAYGAFWLLLAEALDDEFFALDRRRMKVGSFACLCRTALHEPTLMRALRAVTRLFGVMLDDYRPSLRRRGAIAEIRLDEPAQPGPAFACFALWMIVHGLACWLVGRRIPILAVELRGPMPAYCDDYRVMFSETLRFSRPRNRLLFDAEVLDMPVRRHPAELGGFLAGAPANILVRYRDPRSLAERCKAYLRRRPPGGWPTLDGLAGQFCMSASTLRRKLAGEGQSYRTLKDQVRRDLAIERLERQASCAELAGELGFADTSAFYKAFKKWTGCTPGRYLARETAGCGPSGDVARRSAVTRAVR